MKTFKIHFVRHGTTQGNLDGIYVGGGTDLPLCEEGRQNLHQLAAQFSYPTAPLLFCSPMLRAAQTADILFPDVPERMVLENLRENRFGEFEGREALALANDERFKKWLEPNSNFVPEGGESGKEFALRTQDALYTMMMHMVKKQAFSAICVTHGGVIMSIFGQRALPKKPPTQWMADNGCGYTAQFTTAQVMRDAGLVEAIDVLPYGYLG